MLFSGSSSAKVKKEKEKKPDKDDRRELLEAVFVRWANSIAPDTVKELSDIVDTKFLSVYVQLITGESFISCGSRAQDVLNALRLIDNDDRFSQINIAELLEGNSRAICAFVWQLVQIFWKRYAPLELQDQKLTEALKDWCVERVQQFDVFVNDFTSSWRDGYALNALLLSYNPDLFSIDHMRDMRADERIEHAMGLAERYLNVPRLLHPKDFYSERLDMKCVVCYLMVLYLSLTTQVPPSPQVPRTQRAAAPPQLSPTASTSAQIPLSGSSTPRAKSSTPESTEEQAYVTATEQSMESLLSPQSPTSRRAPRSGSADIRSRKSSSSSLRSGRRKSRVMEETITEFEECLEHVLAWLLEAEEQANNMTPVEDNDVEIVKKQFREHEQFMHSLTESQDSVGRVLHRGQLLCPRLGGEQSTIIVSQLLMVNARWEKVREIVMARQNKLQQRLNTLQTEQLESIKKWLDDIEEEIKNARPLSLESDKAEQLIGEHAAIQERIENQQKVVRALSTFVAVVDETDAHFSYENLEKLLQSVGQRWMAVCEWAERRANQLNGLPELIAQYTSAYGTLSRWLDKREEEMSGLRSIHHLESDAEVTEQVRRLQVLESLLEDGHPNFVALSQLAVELVAKLDSTNGADANQIRQQIETITQRWDNIVSRIDEHSHMLVKSGKAEARYLRRLDSSEELEDESRLAAEEEPRHSSLVKSGKAEARYLRRLDSPEELEDENRLAAEEEPRRSSSTVQFTTCELPPPDLSAQSDPLVSSASTASGSTVVSPVDLFVRNVGQVSEHLKPLIEWTYQFEIDKNLEDVRSVIQICQGKLREIKEKETRVNELHAELERIHNLDVPASQLRLANDTFENFTVQWSRIVTKISDALNALSAYNNLPGAESEVELERIGTELNEFFEKAKDIVSSCAQIPYNEREGRVNKLREQLQEQDKNISFLELNHPDKGKVDALKKQYEELRDFLDKLSEEDDTIIMRFEAFLRASFPAIGDIEKLTEELEQCDELLAGLHMYKINDAKVEQLERLGITKRESLANYLDRSQRNEQKFQESEDLLATLTERFAILKSANFEVVKLLREYKLLQNDVEKGLVTQKEFTTLNEEVMSIALSSSAPNRDQIFQKLKGRMLTNAAGWSTLEDDIDESVAFLEKECKHRHQVALRGLQNLVDELRRGMNASRDAADAEEFSEHLDNLERLCEKIETADEELIALSKINERFAREAEIATEQHAEIVSRAKVRIDELESAIRNCEQFDSTLAECQAWCSHVQLILSCRAANDVSALDVPHEYKTAFASGTLISQLQREFDDFEQCIRELREFVVKVTSDWGSPNRLKLQLDHVAGQFEDLMAQFVEFKQPIGLEERTERLFREICDMENSVDELTGLQAESCKQAHDHTMEINRRLGKARVDLDELSESGKILSKEQILSPEAAKDLSEKIDEVDKRLNRVTARNAEMSERMKTCMEFLEEANNDLKKVDAVTESIESRLKAFAAHPSSAETAEADLATLGSLLDELNKNVSLIKNLESIAQRLTLDSFKFDESIIEQRKKIISRLQGDLRSWIVAAQSLAEDRASLLAQFEIMHGQLSNSLDVLEKVDSIEELTSALEKCRPDKNLLIERYRRLVKSDPETETKFALLLSEIEARWNEIEKRCQEARSCSPLGPTPPKLRHDLVSGALRNQIGLLNDLYKIANDYLDFVRFPVASVAEWSKRTQDVDEWLIDYSSRLKSAVEEGRRLASSGRMELDVHDALESLDKAVYLANQVEVELKKNKAILLPVQANAETLEKDISAMCDVLDQLADRNLQEPAIANATQRDLLDRQAQLDHLQRRIDDLHSSLPGTSPNQPNKTMDKLLDKVRDIEEKISVAMKKGVERQHGFLQTNVSLQSKESDAISTTSTGGPSLALEVQETEDERSLLRKTLSTDSESVTTRPVLQESVSSIYVDMDRIEEELTKSDPLPFDNLAEKKLELEVINENLNKIEERVNDSQMLMDLIEGEATRERLGMLRRLRDKRVNDVTDLIGAMENLDSNIMLSRELLGDLEKALAEVDGRNKSPELDELENIALSLEDRLQRALAQIQHTSLKAEPVLSQVGEKKANELREKLRDVGERWKEYEDRVREKRKRLDERLADESELTNEIELLQFWCDEAETECATSLNPLSQMGIAELHTKLEERLNDYESKRETLRVIERLKDRLVNAQLADPATKHRTRRVVSEIGKRLSTIRTVLHDRKTELEEMSQHANAFYDGMKRLQDFCEKCAKAIQLVQSATIFKPSGADLDYVRSQENDIVELACRLQKEWDKALTKEPTPDDCQKTIVEDIFSSWSKNKERLAGVAKLPTLANDSLSEVTTIAEETESSEVHTMLSSIAESEEKEMVAEFNTLNGSLESEEPPTPTLSTKEQALMDAVVHMGHWLNETERDASLTVDIIDMDAQRDAANHMQGYIEQLKLRQLDLIKILDESKTPVVRTRVEIMIKECGRVLKECLGRKDTLMKMLEESRAWDRLRSAINLWLTDVQERVLDGVKIDAANEQTLKSELEDVQQVKETIDEMKAKMDELNKKSNHLLDKYRADEGHSLSHATSKLNTLWTKFNDNLRIRRAVLEAALRSRKDFQSALAQLEEWMEHVDTSLMNLNEATSNLQTLKDSVKRKEWIKDEKNVSADMQAHDDVVRSVQQMGTQLIRRVENARERERLGERLNHVSIRWRHLCGLADAIRTRLLNAEEEWEKLITQLSENLFWVETQSNALLDEQPVGGLLARVQEQSSFIEKLEREMAQRQRDIDECVTLANSYLMQHDLRPRMRTASVLAIGQESDDEKAELRRLGLQIKSDSEKLLKKWGELKEQLSAWSRIIEDAHTKMEKLAGAVAECQLALSNLEEKMENLRPVEDLRLEELPAAVDECEELKESLARARIHIDDANDWSGQLLASDVDLAPEPSAQLKSINDRMNKLKNDVRVRVAALEHAMIDFGPSSQHFLMNSIQQPWQRAVSNNNHLPYYINHETEVTQWDHPAMVEIMEELATFNQVKFSAYRTAMKLRAMQKRLCLDLLTLEDVDSRLRTLKPGPGEQYLSMKDAVMCLVPLYESAQEKYPKLIRSVPLAVDLLLNYVLNVFDAARDGILRTFSFRVLLVTLCNSSLEDKYRYLYQLVASGDGVDQKRLALLLYDIIHIPKFFGEAAAFGGSNVEPSVRSCFETAKYSRTISLDDFLNWLKKEPQSVVWLPVMHRLASAEFAKHQAKCNVCKMFPIIGLRYRCLKCFNVDVCQNCFFSQRLAKNHKLSHPMQEYCLPTTSGEDVRDFGLIVKNKLRSRSKNRIGYLPVQTVDEGPPLETSTVTPVNPMTEPIHNRIQLCARRLWRARGDNGTPALHLMGSVDEVQASTVDLKSPLQLLSQVEQMHKEELDQVLHKLQHENRELKKEIERRKKFDGGVGSTPNLARGTTTSRSDTENMGTGRSVPSLPHSNDEQLLREAYLLRQHKDRLEQRSRILEEQNRQLETQLARLRTIIAQQQQNASSESRESGNDERESSVASGDEDEGIEFDRRPNRMHSLIASVDQLGRAMESFVVSVVSDSANNYNDDDDVTVTGN